MKRPFLTALAGFLYAVTGVLAAGMRLVRWRRDLIREHVHRCLPEEQPGRRRAIERSFYPYLGELAAEVLYGRFLDRESLAERVRFENAAAVEERLAAGRKVLILSAHHGNWEWLLWRCSTGFAASLTAVYKRLRNPRLERVVLAMRERFGGRMVQTKRLVQHLMEQRGRVPLLAMLADQSPAASNPQQAWVEFFGRQTAFHGGPGWIAAKFGYDVYFAAMRRERRGHYVVRLVELLPGVARKEPDALLRAYAQAIEDHVRAHPEQYFWAYNRWKREKGLYE